MDSGASSWTRRFLRDSISDDCGLLAKLSLIFWKERNIQATRTAKVAPMRNFIVFIL